MDAYEHLRYEQDGPVTVITIDRPERMNAIGPQTHRELVAAWSRFRDDDDQLVAVLTGSGTDAFCAGGDLKAAFAGEGLVSDDDAERDAHARGERPGILGPSRWTDLHKPTIAAVNGVAYAGGLEWACWTDMAIADAHATFGVTCRRWNIGLADGGTQRLPRIVGYRRAMELIVTGRVIEADEALRPSTPQRSARAYAGSTSGTIPTAPRTDRPLPQGSRGSAEYARARGLGALSRAPLRRVLLSGEGVGNARILGRCGDEHARTIVRFALRWSNGPDNGLPRRTPGWFFPRLALVVVWISTDYVDRAFDSFILPLLGLFVLPLTTLVYALAWVPGVHLGGGRWLWVALAFVVELAGYAGTGRTNRDRLARD